MTYHDTRHYRIYCWDDETSRRNIVVNGQVVSVTANLEHALRSLRTCLHNDTVVWADALCVNQEDVEERSLQVRLMSMIYTKANIVFALLDAEGYVGVPGCLEDLRGLLAPQYPHTEQRVRDRTLSTALRAISAVLSSPLWRQRWIIQELVTASDVTVICDRTTISRTDLSRAVMLCSTSKSWTRKHKSAALYFQTILQTRNDFWNGKPLTLQHAIIKTRNYLSKDPRDNVYALLGIASDGQMLVPTPNYLQDASQVCAELTKAILRRTTRLQIILAYPRKRSLTTSLPTWSPDWCSLCLSPASSVYLPLHHPLTPYSFPMNSNILRVYGITVGRITAMTSSSDNHKIPLPVIDASAKLVQVDLCKNYYNGRSNVAFTLLTLLKRPRFDTMYGGAHHSPNIMKDMPHLQKDATLRFRFRCYNVSVKWLAGLGMSIESRPLLDWLDNNEDFLIDAKAMRNHLSLRSFPSFWVCLISMVIVLLVSGVSLHASVAFGRLSKVTHGFKGPLWTRALLIIFLVSSISSIAFILAHVYNLITWHRFDRSFASMTNRPARLFLSDQGAIGSACEETRLGDQICFLAGLPGVIVLREHIIDGHLRHMVVESASVYLNDRDECRHQSLYAKLDKNGQSAAAAATAVETMAQTLVES